MFYSLFYCSLLLALFPPFGSSTTRSLLRYHTLHITLSHAPRHPLTPRRFFQYSLCSSPPLAPHYAITLSLPPSHAPQALPTLAPCHPLTLRRLFHHSLLTTPPLAPRHPPTLQNSPQHPLFCNPKYHGRRCEKA